LKHLKNNIYLSYLKSNKILVLVHTLIIFDLDLKQKYIFLFVSGLACIHIATIADHLNILKFVVDRSKNVNITVSIKYFFQ
jgi:hypothetical protein